MEGKKSDRSICGYLVCYLQVDWCTCDILRAAVINREI